MKPSTYMRGESLGDYGGHDIALIEIKDYGILTFQVERFPLIPRNESNVMSNDQNVHFTLAGYGDFNRYHSKNEFDEAQYKCITNEYGRMKFHYCDDLLIPDPNLNFEAKNPCLDDFDLGKGSNRKKNNV